MKKDTNNLKQPKPNITAAAKAAPSPFNDELRTTLAISMLTFLLSLLFLYIFNYIIYSVYQPDVVPILEKILPLTIVSPTDFTPEPVERTQFQLSLLTTPIFILGVFFLLNKKRSFFDKNGSIAFSINIAGVIAFIFYFLYLLSQKLLFVPDATTASFFDKNIFGKGYPLLAFICYCAFIYLLVIFLKKKEFGFIINRNGF